MAWLATPSQPPPPPPPPPTTTKVSSCKIKPPPPPPKAAAVEAHDLAKLEAYTKPPALASGKRIETWPFVPCFECEIQVHYKKMYQKRKWVEEHEDEHDGKEDIVLIEYFCAQCMAVEWGCTEAEAMSRVKLERPDLQRVRRRTAEWEAAGQELLKTTDVAGLKKGEIRQLTRQTLLEVFRPAMKAILIKRKQLRERAKLTAEHLLLCEELARCTDLDKCEEMINQIELLDEQIMDKSMPLAFADKSKDLEEQFRWQMAADYSDAWTEIRDNKGKLIGGFSAFYICEWTPDKGKTPDEGKTEECHTLILSKVWGRKHEDPLKSKQKWYCKICGTKYKTYYGMLVEIREVGTNDVCHALANCTDDDDRGTKALILEERYGQEAKTPEDLYRLVPTIEPTLGQCLRKAVPQDFWRAPHYPYSDFGVYKLQSLEVLKSAKRWNWKDMSHFFQNDEVEEC